ncbi:MAG: nicotinate-nucleotide adenylyltransferase [Caulobacterales bacterium]|nr:nicotinate-nucleotide adenylyltransferase [Caulobacterales bacterium]
MTAARAPASRSTVRTALLQSEIAAPGLRVGLFGGSFNPPHDGHLHVAQTALTRLQLDRVWWLVSPQNPLKTTAETADYEARLAAVQRLARGPRFTVSDLERRMDARASITSLSAVIARHPGTRFVWIMGGDNLVDFHRWERWTDIMALLPICVVARPGTTIRAPLSRAAHMFARRRIPAGAANKLVELAPPAWVYLASRLHPASSTALRAAEITPPHK